MVQGFRRPLIGLVVLIVLLDSGRGSSKREDGGDVVSNVIWLVQLSSRDGLAGWLGVNNILWKPD